MRYFKRLGFFGSALFWLAVYNIAVGAGTLRHLSGHPEDAPHLHASDFLRGWIWILLALTTIIIVSLASRHKEWIDYYRAGLSLLIIMPAVRGFSYLAAWVLSWDFLDSWDVVDNAKWWEEGSPSGWYTCLPWLGEVTLILYLSRGLGRFRERGL